jgi:hypothetical protein
MSKKGGLMGKHIHDAVADDDCQTDEECRGNAIRCQQRNMRSAIYRFVDLSPEGAKYQVKNLDLTNRYKHCEQGKVSAYVDSDLEE